MSKEVIGVVFGGTNVERNISIITAHGVIDAIDSLDGYEACPIFLTSNSIFVTGRALRDENLFSNEEKLLEKTSPVCFYRDEKGFFIELLKQNTAKEEPVRLKLDVIFLAVHGQNAEDGTIAGFFNTFNVPFTGPNVSTSAICMNKHFAKTLVRGKIKIEWQNEAKPEEDAPKKKKYIRLEVVPGEYITKTDYSSKKTDVLEKIIATLGFKPALFVKPVDSGSSAGIRKIRGRVENKKELEEKMDYAFRYSNGVLVEKYIPRQREVSCAVLGDTVNIKKVSECRVNIIPGGYDFYAPEVKYPGAKKKDDDDSKIDIPSFFSPGHGYAKKGGGVTPVDELQTITSTQEKKIQKFAAKVFEFLSCSGMVRIDFFVDPDDTIYFNEVNTLPGSFSVNLWEASNVKYTDVIKDMIYLAKKAHAHRKKLDKQPPL